jgi:hypothetical protein
LSKDLSARSRISSYLSGNGPVEDVHGRATIGLKDAVGYAGSTVGFAQLIASMERSGQITRDVRGKRTYRIASAFDTVPATHAVAAPADENGHAESAVPHLDARPTDLSTELDYEELAATLLARVSRTLAAPAEPDRPVGSVQRRLDRLNSRNAELERCMARAQAERDAVIAERDELRSQLEAASHNLSLLTEKLGTPRRPSNQAVERLGSDERALLFELSGRTQGRRHAG